MPALTKCYYEVLGVERNADDEAIKKSFRKLALQLHPDKNPDRSEEAKVEFQYLQQAYAVLSNPQERAWYDEHRLAVLRGGLDAEFEDYNIDLIPFCSSSCYKGFGDEETGFYTVYREVFEKIIAEEMEANEGSSESEIPGFGDSTSDYKDVVGPFYAYWEAFCTLRTFAWIDEFDTRQAENRRVARLMDKENKKLRSEARKDWNQRVRALVDFVKRKDKRVQAWKIEYEAELKAKQEAMAKKSSEEKARRRKERKQLLENLHKTKNAAVVDHHQNQLKEMEEWVSNEFGEGNSSEQSMDEEVTCLHCAACNKTFKSEKAFSNHEKSKKHFAQVELLKQAMEAEDAQFGEAEDSDEEECGNEGEVSQNEDGSDNNEDNESSVAQDTGDSEAENVITSDEPNGMEHSKGDVKERIEKLSSSPVINKNGNADDKNSNSSDAEFGTQDECAEMESSLQGEKFDLSKIKEGIEEISESNAKKKRRANKATRGEKTPALDVPKPPTVTINEICAVCKQKFPSRNKLFKHMKSSGHSVPLEVATAAISFEDNERAKNKKGKRKNK